MKYKGTINMINLEQDTIAWATDRGIIRHSSPQIQMLKLMSEMGELADNLGKGNDIEDDIGDCLVVLTLIANMTGTDLTKCYNVAYNDIKDRKGILSKEGIFVKESDKRYKQLVMEFDDSSGIYVTKVDKVRNCEGYTYDYRLHDNNGGATIIKDVERNIEPMYLVNRLLEDALQELHND